MRRSVQNVLFAVPVISGILSLGAVFFYRSEEKNALLFGLSKFRLALAAASFLLIIFAVLIFLNRRSNLQFLYYISGSFGILCAEILLFSRFPSDDTRNLLPLIVSRALPFLTALFVSSLSWLAALLLLKTDRSPVFGLFLFSAAVLIYWGISSHIDRYAWQIDLQGNTGMCLASVLAALIWYLALQSEIGRAWKTTAGCIFFIVAGFCVTRSTGMWMGRGETPPKAYWNELAEAFLNHRFYLEHPSGTHDLTFYNGKWYVPNPPLPGILLMPVTALKGSAYAVNMCIYSAVIAGINSGLFFLALMLAFTKGSGPLAMPISDDTSYPGNSFSIASWVTILFVFGTDHLWLGTTGQMWFVSQLLVVTFTLLACICVICRFSPVWAGIILGLGMLCRPNIFPIWLCLLGIWLYQERDFPRFDLKKTVVWCLKSGIPVVISVFLLLLYNKVRFDDWMDFGYVTINGADWILDAVQEYGMFHPHFLKINADVMLFGMPGLDFSGERFFFQPHVAGYSIFLMTPPLIYVFRSFRKNWFSVCTWASVLLSVLLLLFYHNTGAEQIGYRYILDIAAPLALLTADGLRGRVDRLFKLLTAAAVFLSFTAIYWWYLGRI